MTPASELILPRSALKALGELPDFDAGPLSPLLRIAAPDGASDRAGLLHILKNAQNPWQAAVPALIDPGLTVMLVLADQETTLIGQYLWPDKAGAGPGFGLATGTDELRMSGPVLMDSLLAGVEKALSLDGHATAAALSITFTSEELFAFAALADAYKAASARQMEDRLADPSTGIPAGEVIRAWRVGTSGIDPAWSVSLFALVNPDAVPDGMEQRLPAVLGGMVDSGKLAALEGEGESGDDLYVLSPELDLLCHAISASGVSFGLAVQRPTAAAGMIEVTMAAGWRTGAGIWITDLSDLRNGTAELILMDGNSFTRLLGQVLGTDRYQGDEEAGFEAGNSLEPLIGLLEKSPVSETEAPTAGTAAPEIKCASCGAVGKTGAAFCGHCGKPLHAPAEAPAASFRGQECTACGQKLSPGAAFCGHCGAKV